MSLWRSSDLFATLLFGWTAECATSCLLPTLDLGTRWDAISTLLNVTGALFTGLASGIATQRNSAALARLIPCFQGGFVGVWTSFAFMAEHGAEIAWESPTRFRRAASYMAASLACGLGANWVGFRLGRDVAALGGAAVRIAASSWLPRLLAAVVVGCVARAFLSLSGLPRFPKGWVSDPANPQFRGMKEVQSLHRDWKEILTGLAYATLAVVTGVVMPLTGVAMPLTGVVVAGDHIGGWPGYAETLLPWSTLRCNFVALAFVVGAFYLKEIHPELIRNVVFIKLVSSYSGAVSAFGGTCDETVQLLVARRGGLAAVNLLANSGVALLAAWLLHLHHSRYRRLELAATKISKLVRQRSARKQLHELQRLHSDKQLVSRLSGALSPGTAEEVAMEQAVTAVLHPEDHECAPTTPPSKLAHAMCVQPHRMLLRAGCTISWTR